MEIEEQNAPKNGSEFHIGPKVGKIVNYWLEIKCLVLQLPWQFQILGSLQYFTVRENLILAKGQIEGRGAKNA